MPRLAANISMLFTEHAFLDRIAAAARAGFRGIECQFPYRHNAVEVARRLRDARLDAVLINTSPGADEGDFGFAALPGREAAFTASFEEALDYARGIASPLIHVLAGRVAAGPESEATFIANLRRAAARAATARVTLLIEPLNAHDQPGYFLRTTGQAVALLDRIDRANVRLQLDFYHCQISEGDLARHAERLHGRYAHVQVAGVPGRHEPDCGEINYAYLLALLDRLGYDGWVGAEYQPAGATLAGLGWAQSWGIGGAA